MWNRVFKGHNPKDKDQMRRLLVRGRQAAGCGMNAQTGILFKRRCSAMLDSRHQGAPYSNVGHGMSVRFHPSAVCTSICSEELFSVRTETMGTTDHLILQYQRQTCLLQLCSKRSHLFKQSEAGVTRREASKMHKSVL
ncbi:uncharacterized protein LOC133401754 isoform X3 [Phycodurus eques]|uniref:uncharacterized protein LOC133401754 isoform X3 n=1 Tax=Phycodurus eques TaxID=693459 RepID=UPI002ACEB30A|nr:uncharacterized protein LOC133401754 isoform X3 [Phycodurus eques]